MFLFSIFDKAVFIQRVSLIGMAGAGKTFFGKLLSEHMKTAFFDLDHIIEQHTGMPVSRFFAAYNQETFRNLERQLLMDTLKSNTSFVLATGGGTFLCPFNRTKLMEATHTVWLDTPFSIISQRLSHQEILKRPNLLNSHNPINQAYELYRSRKQYYQYAHTTLESLGNPKHSAMQIINNIRYETHCD